LLPAVTSLCGWARSPQARALPPRPTRSPLFPYTTLFRSGLDNGALHAVGHLVGIHDDAAVRIARRAANGLNQRSFRAQEAFLVRDRKSTRLNSSHVSISYAVFCLKKKTTSKSTTPSPIK